MLRRRPPPVISRRGAALFGLLAALLIAPMLVPIPGFTEELAAGDIAPRTLVARHDAQFVSETQTEAARAAAARAEPEVRTVDVSVQDQQIEAAEAFFMQLSGLLAEAGLTAEQRLNGLLQSEAGAGLPRSVAIDLLALDALALERAQAAVFEALTEILAVPVTQAAIPAAIAGYLEAAPLNDAVAEAVSGVLGVFARENFVLDEERTEENRQRARDNAAPVVISITRGQTIVSAGAMINAADVELLREAGVIADLASQVADWAAGILIAAGAGTILTIFLYQLQPVTGRAMRRLVVVGVAGLAVLLAARVALPQMLPDTERHFWAYALPIATAAMLTASLLELRFAAVVAVVIGLLVPLIATTAPDIVAAEFTGPVESLQLGVAYTMAGLAGAGAVYRADRLGRFGLGGLAVGLTMFIVLLVFWLLEKEFGERSLGWIALVSAANGAGSAVITVGVFVLLSTAFGVTTRLQLMELAQNDHPLLGRLQEEAPGTFQHSMMVGNLAERAARSIGADPLVTRVGAYYHDIGKLEQPSYYVENQLGASGTPHDGLSPRESAARIMEHVTNGVVLARRHHLPALITDFIPQHHGTRLVTFFYRKALEDGEEVSQSSFRYGGPRPQTKESAIVMLADSCEALVRAEKDADDAQIADLVDGVFAERLAEGQLDECDITMRDLQTAAASFKATLRAIYHPRIAYPAPRPEELAALGAIEQPRPNPENPPG